MRAQNATMTREEAEKLFEKVLRDTSATGTIVRIHDVYQENRFVCTYLSVWHDGNILFTIPNEPRWNAIFVFIQCMFSKIQSPKGV